MADFLVFSSLFAVFYAYFGYPLVLYLISRKSAEDSLKEGKDFSLGIVIAAHNEEDAIEKKINQTLDLKYKGKLVSEHLASNNSLVEVIVANDASRDSTAQIVKKFSSKGVKLCSNSVRGGKAKAQSLAVSKLSSDLILFFDTKISLTNDALDNFTNYFNDPKVGAVSSVDQVITDESFGEGEASYVGYEMKLREMESNFNSLITLSGSCFAVRKEIANYIDEKCSSDFWLILKARSLGFKGVQANNVIASYYSLESPADEFKRKIRTVAHGLSTTFKFKECLNFAKYGSFSWQVWSHKVFRWLSPFFLIVTFISTYALAPYYKFYYLFFLLQILFILLALSAFVFPSLRNYTIFRIPLFFCLSNLAIVLAFYHAFISGKDMVWSPTKRQF